MTSRQPLASNREDQVPSPARRFGNEPEGKDEGEFVKLFFAGSFSLSGTLDQRERKFYG